MYPDSKDAEALESVDDKNKGGQSLVAVRLVANCSKFKQPRLDKIQKYRDLYAGKVAPKLRPAASRATSWFRRSAIPTCGDG